MNQLRHQSLLSWPSRSYSSLSAARRFPPYRQPLMPDDKSKVGEPDRSRVAADQDHEVSHLAETLAQHQQ